MSIITEIFTLSGSSKPQESPLDTIKKLNFPHDRWYIAGGSLLKNTGDIDIYFYDEQDFKDIFEFLDKPDYSTANAHTYHTEGTTIQLICKEFGNPIDILSHFDLNKSRQAMYPNGTLYIHPTFNELLYIDIDHFSTDTIARFVKYIDYKDVQFDNKKFNLFIEYLVENHDKVVTDYYTNSDVNYFHLVLRTMKHFFIKTNIIMQAIDKHELLIRLELYSELISFDSDILPTETYSIEQQLFTSKRHASHYYTKASEEFLLKNPVLPPDLVLNTYPEYFI